ncbi:MAG: hypothetical protein ABR523_07425, partial [Desulfurivibrionaceae bacterium]
FISGNEIVKLGAVYAEADPEIIKKIRKMRGNEGRDPAGGMKGIHGRFPRLDSNLPGGNLFAP